MADARYIPLGAPWPAVAAPGFNSFSLNQSTDAVEFIFQVEPNAASYTLTRAGFRQGTVTGTPPTYRVSIQGVDASGNPDGTIKGGGNCYFDYTPVSGNNNTWRTGTFGTSYAAAPGEYLALVIAYTGVATIDASNFANFTTDLVNVGSFPYVTTNNNGSRTRSISLPCFAVGTAGSWYGYPCEGINQMTFNDTTNPDEIGTRFVIPSGWADTFKVMGVKISAQTIPAAATITIRLFDTDGTTVLQDATLDSDAYGSASSRNLIIWFDESSLSALTCGSAYRVTCHVSGSSNLFINYMEADANGDLVAYALGIDCYATQRNNGGAFTDNTLRRYWIEPILADLTEPSGGAAGGFIIGG